MVGAPFYITGPRLSQNSDKVPTKYSRYILEIGRYIYHGRVLLGTYGIEKLLPEGQLVPIFHELSRHLSLVR